MPHLLDDRQLPRRRLRQVVHVALDETDGLRGVGAAGGEPHAVEHVTHRDLVALAEADVLVEPVTEERVLQRRSQILRRTCGAGEGAGEGEVTARVGMAVSARV